MREPKFAYLRYREVSLGNRVSTAERRDGLTPVQKDRSRDDREWRQALARPRSPRLVNLLHLCTVMDTRGAVMADSTSSVVSLPITQEIEQIDSFH